MPREIILDDEIWSSSSSLCGWNLGSLLGCGLVWAFISFFPFFVFGFADLILDDVLNASWCSGYGFILIFSPLNSFSARVMIVAGMDRDALISE